MKRNFDAKILKDLTLAVENYDSQAVESICNTAVAQNLDPVQAIEEGLAKGMEEVSRKFEAEEIFLPELIVAGEAMKKGIRILEPHLEASRKERKNIGKVVMGTVAGDVHDLGKQIVSLLFFIAGFEIQDLGINVPAERFVEAVRKLQPDMLGLSALMTTTIPQQKHVIDALRSHHLREKVVVMVGGAATDEEWAEEIGADGWAPNAVLAVKEARTLMRRE